MIRVERIHSRRSKLTQATVNPKVEWSVRFLEKLAAARNAQTPSRWPGARMEPPPSMCDVWCVAHMYVEFFFDHVGWAQQQNSNNKRSGLRGIYRNEELPDTCGSLFFTYQYLVRGPTVIFAVEGGVQIHLPLLLMLKCSRWTNKFPYGRCYDLFCVSLKFSSFHDVDDLLDSPSPRSGSLTPAYDRSSSPSNLPVDNDPSNLQMPTTGM